MVKPPTDNAASSVPASTTNLVSGGLPGKPDPKSKDPQQVAKAASDFEGLLIGELLKAARSGGSGWLDTDSEDADSTLAEMSEQTLATSLASSGGLGLAKMVTTNLQKSENKTVKVNNGD